MDTTPQSDADIIQSFFGDNSLFSNNLGSLYNIIPGNYSNLGNQAYSSGFDYARSIAGGMPMSQVIAPGVSYSPEQPSGYTQAQLNGDTPIDRPVAPPPPVRDDQIFVPPVTPPIPQVPDDAGFLGTGIGGVTIPFDRQQVPVQLPQIDLSNIDFSQIQIPEEFRTGLQGLLGIPQIDTEALTADILGQVPSFDPTGLQSRLGALESQQIPVFDPSGLQEQITSLQQRPGFDPSGLQEQITGLQQRPGFDPSQLQEQIGLLQQQVPSRDDFMSIQQDIADLSAREIPQFDPTGLQEQITQLQQQPGFDPTALQEQITQLGQRPGFDPTQLQQQISELQTRPGFDSSGLQQQISGLQENIGQITPFDPSTLQERLGLLEQQVPTRDDFMSIQQDINQLQTRPQFDPSGLQQQIGSLEQQIGGIPQFDPTSLQQQIGALQQRPGFDPSTLQEQITALQQRPSFDPSGLQQQIGGLQQQIGGITPFDPSTLQQRLGALEQQVPSQDDFMSIQQDISQLQASPGFDPSGLQQQIEELQGRPSFDPSGLQQQIGALQQRPSFDPSSLQQQIQDLQSRPGFDPSQLQEQISGLQSNIAGIRPYDPSGLEQQISGLQQQIGGIPQFDPTGIQQQIAANQAAIAGINIPTYQAPDLSQFATQQDIQAALAGIPEQKQPDISGLLSRISELETSLSALQQPNGSTFSIDQTPISQLRPKGVI